MLFLLRAPGRFVGQATDHRAVDAQIRQIAVGQRIQFAHGLPVHGAAGAVFLHVLDRGHQTAGDARGSGVMGMSDCSHGIFLSASAPCPDGLVPFDEPKMALMLHVHNGSFRIAAMQHPHDWLISR